MAADSERWNTRYLTESGPSKTTPSAFLQEVLPILPRGIALDLAMGAGRNAVFLATKGWHVLGMDCSRVALEQAAELARRSNVRAEWIPTDAQPSLRNIRGLMLCEADLEEPIRLPTGFDVIICFNFLARPLLPSIERALGPGGALVYETYTTEQLRFAHGPRNPEHLLRPGELRECFPEIHTLFYREFSAGRGRASLLGIKAAA